MNRLAAFRIQRPGFLEAKDRARSRVEREDRQLIGWANSSDRFPRDRPGSGPEIAPAHAGAGVDQQGDPLPASGGVII